jgi:phosphate starvation-inducible PhoH-like protein
MTKRREKFTAERRRAPVRPLNDRQAEYIAALCTHDQVVVMGPAGTGKTYIPAIMAADAFLAKRISKIILTRPNVPAGRSLGFFPGTMEEKIAPWMAEVIAVLTDRMGAGVFEIALKRGDIEIVPFEVMRGRTFRDAYVILDEAQNTLPVEMKMFLTRIGEDTKVVINGDVAQSDLKETSGLKTILNLINKQGLPVPVVEFGMEDIVRSGACAMWVKAFHKSGL